MQPQPDLIDVFKWRRKDDGFEWRNYVRTTILVRRKKRKQIQDTKADVASPNERTITHNALVVVPPKPQAKPFRLSLPTFPFEAFASLARAATSAAVWIARRLLPLLTPVRSGTAKRTFAATTLLVGAGAAMRNYNFGLDADVWAATLIASATAGVLTLVLVCEWLAKPQTKPNAPAAQSKSKAPTAGTARLWAASALVATLATAIAACLFLLRKQHPAPATGATSASVSTPDKKTLQGRATALKSNTLRMNGKTLQLAGLDAFEYGQTCSQTNGEKWDCEKAAKDALNRLIRSTTISCDLIAPVSPLIAACSLEGSDIALRLVRDGFVFAQTTHPHLTEAEARASEEKRGIWAGLNERPADFRQRKWQEASKKAPNGCPIKTRMISRRKLYLLPWSPDYDRRMPNEAKGERWYCSEADARAQGWAKSG